MAFAAWVPATAAAGQGAADVPPARFADPERRAHLLAALPAIERDVAAAAQDGPPGLAWGLVIDGELVAARALGLRSVADNAPVTTDTVFRIASMSKVFTALAVLKLRDEGKLNLDDTLGRHVSEARRWPRPTADSGPITLRHLLAHTSGFPEDNPQGDRQLGITPAQLSKWIEIGVPFSTATGSEFEYSNLGFVLLGRVVTNVASMPYQRYIAENIFRPLGMRDTTFDPAAVPPQRLARGHRKDGTAWADEPLLPDGEAGAMGGMLTTVADLSKFAAAMLAAWPPRSEPERGPLLRRTLREAQSGQGHPGLFVGRRGGPSGPMHAVAYSYGFGLNSVQHCRWGHVVSHGGGLPGFGSDMRWLPQHGVGVVVFGNATYFGAARVSATVLDGLLATGALKSREPAPSAALQDAARRVAALVSQWRDEELSALAADNLLLDEPLARRREAFAKAASTLGACRPIALLPENALRGRQRLVCEQGWIDLTLTLAPTQPPLVQQLDIASGSGTPPALMPQAMSCPTP